MILGDGKMRKTIKRTYKNINTGEKIYLEYIAGYTVCYSEVLKGSKSSQQSFMKLVEFRSDYI